MACCNYVKCKNRNRTSNHTHACQMESISPPSKRADRRQHPDWTPTGRSAVSRSFATLWEHRPQQSTAVSLGAPRVKQGVFKGYCGPSFLRPRRRQSCFQEKAPLGGGKAAVPWKQAGKQEKCQEQYGSRYLAAMLYHRQKALLVLPTDYKKIAK